jgi:hypothetical protein
MLPVIGSILDIGLQILDKVIPDPLARENAKLQLMKLQQEGELKELEVLKASDVAQATTNTEEAKSSNIFVSGWRPAVGWCCVGGLVYQLMLRPLMSWIMLNNYGWDEAPSLDIETLMTLLFGMLGLGAFRTIEKTRGVTR